jgi:peptide chain release factor 2
VGKEIQLSQLEKDIEHPEFWNNSTSAQRVMKSVSSLRDEVGSWNSLKQHVHDLTELARLDDESLRGELEPNLQTRS